MEKALLNRLGKKANIYGRDLGLDGELSLVPDDAGGSASWRIDVQSVRELYESWIIPLTKEVEVCLCPLFKQDYDSNCCDIAKL